MIRDYRKRKLQQALDVSLEDLKNQLEDLIETKDPKRIANLLKNGLNSSVWIGRNVIDYGKSHINPEKHNRELNPPSSIEIELLKEIKNKSEISPRKATYPEIFKAIFKERVYSHMDQEYDTLLEVPEIRSTMVLVPGVFNEIFSSTSFERGANHLQKKYGIKYFCPKIKGTKSAEKNAETLAEQIKSYSLLHPNEKLWLFAFS